jgi:hypothetical protein
LRVRASGFVARTLVASLLLTLALAAGPAIAPARAASSAGDTTLGGLQRTNQVLAVVNALLKLLDELAALSHDGSPPPPPAVPPPPPSGGGNGLPGPYPGLAPDDPPLSLCPAGY